MSGNRLTCIIVDDDEFSREVISDLVSQHSILDLKTTCSSAMEAYNVLTTDKIDVLFLDIEMPGMSGLDLLANLDKRPIVVLITAKKEYAAESYEYDVADYLVKPVNPGRFMKTVGRVKAIAEQNHQPATNIGPETIFVKSEGLMVNINLNDILFVESMGNYVTIHTSQKKHTVLMTMKEIESKLPSTSFMRVHRKYIVNLREIEAIEDTLIIIKDNLIPIGKSYKDDFFGRLNQL